MTKLPQLKINNDLQNMNNFDLNLKKRKISNLNAALNQKQASTMYFEQFVRHPHQYSIKIPLKKSQKCFVYSFNLVGAEYEKAFNPNPQNPNFKFRFNSKFQGIYEDKLIIEDENDAYLFKVIINVKPFIQQQISLHSCQTKKVTTKLKLPMGSWRISQPNSNIASPTSFDIISQNQQYLLEYYSSKPQHQDYIINFINQQLGQYSYLLKIVIDELPQVKLEPFKVQLGKKHSYPITLQNQSNDTLVINAQSSNPNVFFYQPTVLSIPPNSSINVSLIYRPSSLELQLGKIVFSSQQNYKRVYNIFGYGLLQQQTAIFRMSGLIGNESCQSINFINPFNEHIKIYIFLESQQNIFKTILKSNTMEVNYLQQVFIPISFLPKQVKVYEAQLKIVINEKIFWKYKLQGISICRNTEEVKVFKVQCRDIKQIKAQFLLNHQPNEGISDNLTLKIRTIQPQLNTKINNAISIKNTFQKISENKVSFEIQMNYLKPFEASCQCQISQPNQSKWIFKCNVLFLPPSIDDSFMITSDINQPSTCLFKLTNRTKTHSKFKAYFSSDSNKEFSIWPKTGDLQPYGRDGTPFQVTFAPTQYRSSWRGILIIETEDSYWSYQVKGSLPTYNPPVGVSALSKIKTK